jgi:hypothetical protein
MMRSYIFPAAASPPAQRVFIASNEFTLTMGEFAP